MKKTPEEPRVSKWATREIVNRVAQTRKVKYLRGDNMKRRQRSMEKKVRWPQNKTGKMSAWQWW